ncbi:hypothetical protein Trco_006474 [Trichoderma cornu-damae]|uniref:Uncharacterized protein n=1 Tax=Trichoderma cornu-damae TaxID=654480 RepID=A0A9P8QLW7_9HYPO|nr:hypothetical protein Trco_006474 [Trichoderma cornu-damae]
MLPSCGQSLEEPGDLNGCADGRRHWSSILNPPDGRFELQASRYHVFCRPSGDGDDGESIHGRKCFAAKAKRLPRPQPELIERFQLASMSTPAKGVKVVHVDSAAVIPDPYRVEAIRRYYNFHQAGSSIDGIVDELLDHVAGLGDDERGAEKTDG